MNKEERNAHNELMHRGKILSVSRDLVLSSIQSISSEVKAFEHMELPEGYMVKGVDINIISNSFRFLIIHPDFDRIPSGQEYPRMDPSVMVGKKYAVCEE